MSAPKVNVPPGEGGTVNQDQSTTTVSNPPPLESENKEFASTSAPAPDALAALFERAAAVAKAMKAREFEAAKAESGSHPEIVYALHDIGTDSGLLVPVDRHYHVVGSDPRHAPYTYDAPEFVPLRIEDTPALRAFATEIVKRSWLGTGPTLYVLADDDTRQKFAKRMLALAACVSEQRRPR